MRHFDVTLTYQKSRQKLKTVKSQIVKLKAAISNRGKTEQNSKTEHEYRKPNNKIPQVNLN